METDIDKGKDLPISRRVCRFFAALLFAAKVLNTARTANFKSISRFLGLDEFRPRQMLAAAPARCVCRFFAARRREEPAHPTYWYHANEHIWNCGKALFGEGSAEAEDWSRQREALLWEGCTRRLTEDLAEQIKRHRGLKREALETLRRYILTNEWEMRYDVFRSKGYDIGSGAVEGACKHAIGKRLKQSGMIWKRPGSSATLALRVTWLNGQWTSLWAAKPLAA